MCIARVEALKRAMRVQEAHLEEARQIVEATRREVAEEIAQAIEAMPSVRQTFGTSVVLAERAAAIARRIGGDQ